MTADEKQTKTYNAEYDGFEVRFADGSWKIFSKYGYALRYARKNFTRGCQIIGHKFTDDLLGTIETVLN